MQRLSIDIIGHLLMTKGSYAYTVTCLHVARFLTAYPIKNVTSAVGTQCLELYLMNSGVPESIICYNRPAFVSNKEHSPGVSDRL